MPATTAYGVDLILELGVGRQGGAGRWDTATWDATYWSQTDTALGDWVEASCDVRDTFTLSAGTSDREGLVTRWEAASTAFTLDGPEWDPWNGPWAGILGPQVAVRWRWRPTGTTDWLPLFFGAVTDGGWDWDPGTETAKVTAQDGTADLVGFDPVKQAPVGAGDTGAARVARVLDNARWPANRRDITPGGVPMVATELEQTAWAELLHVSDTDLALLWMRRDGRLSYRPQGRGGAGTVTAGILTACPLPDHPEAVQVVDMEGSEPSPVANIVAVRGGTPPGGVDPPYVTVTDETSVSRFRPHMTGFDLLHDATARPDWSGLVATVMVGASAWPSMAPRQLTVGLVSGDGAKIPGTLFSLELDQSFQVVDTGGRSWLAQVAGWDVVAGWDTCGGTLHIADVTRWMGSPWDTGQWDTARWGLGKIG